MGSGLGLKIILWVPVRVKDNHCVGRGQVNPKPSSPGGQQETEVLLMTADSVNKNQLQVLWWQDFCIIFGDTSGTDVASLIKYKSKINILILIIILCNLKRQYIAYFKS